MLTAAVVVSVDGDGLQGISVVVYIQPGEHALLRGTIVNRTYGVHTNISV